MVGFLVWLVELVVLSLVVVVDFCVGFGFGTFGLSFSFSFGCLG